jgi:hypothetical protein
MALSRTRPGLDIVKVTTEVTFQLSPHQGLEKRHVSFRRLDGSFAVSLSL